MSNIRVRLLTARHETVQSKLNNLIEEFRSLLESANRLADRLPEGDELMQVVAVRTHAEEFLDANGAEH